MSGPSPGDQAPASDGIREAGIRNYNDDSRKDPAEKDAYDQRSNGESVTEIQR